MLLAVAVALCINCDVKTVTVLLTAFVTTMSGMPSPLKSPAATNVGLVLVPVDGLAAAVNVPSPLPKRTVTVLLKVFATARSDLPSPLKSPTATDSGLLPVDGLAAAVNVPSPLPNRTVTVLLKVFATAKSGLPSPLKSPTAIDSG